MKNDAFLNPELATWFEHIFAFSHFQPSGLKSILLSGEGRKVGDDVRTVNATPHNTRLEPLTRRLIDSDGKQSVIVLRHLAGNLPYRCPTASTETF